MPSQPRDVSTNETSSPPTDAAMQSDWSPVAPPTLAPPTKQYADSSVQTSASEIVKALDSAVQTEMFLDEIDSLASKLDPERVSHYERMVSRATSLDTGGSGFDSRECRFFLSTWCLEYGFHLSS